jgi:hypothetical protein
VEAGRPEEVAEAEARDSVEAVLLMARLKLPSVTVSIRE